MAYHFDPANKCYRATAYPDTDTFRAELKLFCREHNLLPHQVKVTVIDDRDDQLYFQLSHEKAATALQLHAEAIKAAIDVARRYKLKELS